MDVSMIPGYLMAGPRRLFHLRVCPHAAPTTRRVMVVPPFGEEMNKCRRLLALLARALAREGCEVWLPDLSGTGDSGGDFAAARWSDWLDDLVAVDAQAAAALPVSYLAVRSGALLLAQAHTRLAAFPTATVVLWQPVLDGSRFLAQFLRLRVMASRLAGQDESQQQLMQLLSDGHSIEVAGYGLHPALAFALHEATAGATEFGGAARLTVLEFKNGEGGQASVPVQNLVRDCLARGAVAQAAVVNCDQFWATQEIAAPEAALAASVAALTRPVDLQVNHD